MRELRQSRHVLTHELPTGQVVSAGFRYHHHHHHTPRVLLVGPAPFTFTNPSLTQLQPSASRADRSLWRTSQGKQQQRQRQQGQRQQGQRPRQQGQRPRQQGQRQQQQKLFRTGLACFSRATSSSLSFSTTGVAASGRSADSLCLSASSLARVINSSTGSRFLYRKAYQRSTSAG